MASSAPKPAVYVFESDGKTFVIDHPSLHSHYALAGQLSAVWAHIEFTLDATIWEMSGSVGSTGPSITAQMLGVRPRAHAITAILRGFGAPENLIGKVDSFSQESYKVGHRRNRAIHDVWLWSEADREAYQFRVEADGKKLGFGLEQRPLSALQHDLEEIDNFRHRCIALKDEILVWYRALPEERRAVGRPFRA